MKIYLLPLKQLYSISPSQYSALKKCPYSVLLATTYGKPLLPYSPGGHLGNVIHKCIRLIFTYEIHDKTHFNKVWQELINQEETILTERGYRFLTPLRRTVKGYAIKKLQVKALLDRKRSSKNFKINAVKFSHEQRLKSKDGLISGRADLIIESEYHIKITDFKSGRIFNEEGEIKKDYEDQLKLYAYLYYEMRNKFPDELTLVDLKQNEYSIEFSEEESEAIAAEAKDILQEINEKVKKDQRELLANSSHENCRLCLYKPACEYHWKLVDDEESAYVNLKGELCEVKEFANGNVNARIKCNDKEVVVSHLNSNSAEELKGCSRANVAFYNVLKDEGPGRYRAIKSTKFYEE